MKKQPQNLTEQENQFAAEHHNLIYQFLSENKLPEEEYYDVVVFAYLSAIKEYFKKKGMSQIEFVTLLWQMMSSACLKYENSKYVSSLKTKELYVNSFFFEENTPDSKDCIDELLSNMSVEKALHNLNQREYKTVELMMRNYPQSEILKIIDISSGELTSLISVIQTKFSMECEYV